MFDDVALQLSSYRTLVMSFATACAYARGGASIEDWDVRAGASLFLGVMQTRRRLVPMTYARVETWYSMLIYELENRRHDGSFWGLPHVCV